MLVSLTTSAVLHASILLSAWIFWEKAKPLEAPPPEAVMVDLVSPKEIPQLSNQPPVDQQPFKPIERPAQKPAEPANIKPVEHADQKSQPLAEPQGQADSAVDPTAAITWLQGIEEVQRSTQASEIDTRPSDNKAKLSPDKIAEFKAHLSKCWVAPAGTGAASKLKSVIRISLTEKGALMTEPVLLLAPASASGPLLVKSAMRALQQCQPFNFLPAESYKEWKTLDLRFTPEGLSGV